MYLRSEPGATEGVRRIAVTRIVGVEESLADLRESGAIEQDADVVMFIYREDVYDQTSERKGIADILVSKHRNGPIGKKELFFHDRFAKFESLDNREVV